MNYVQQRIEYSFVGKLVVYKYNIISFLSKCLYTYTAICDDSHEQQFQE